MNSIKEECGPVKEEWDEQQGMPSGSGVKQEPECGVDPVKEEWDEQQGMPPASGVKHEDIQTSDTSDSSVMYVSTSSKSPVSITFSMSPSFDEGLFCEFCGQCFYSKIFLRLHVLSHFSKELFECEMCGEFFLNISDFNCHMETHTREKPYSCLECGKSYSQLGSLKRHITRTHTGERPFSCWDCHETFLDAKDRSFHEIRYHRRDQRHYPCKHCRKSFTQLASLEYHSRAHREAKFCCNTCGMKFSYFGHLRLHSKSHRYVIDTI